MPILRNPKHERFAQELAKGKTVVKAYAIAGFKPDRGNAIRLQRKVIVEQRVAEILASRERADAQATERAIERTAITKTQVIAMLVEDRELAREKGQAAAAIRAAELLGKEIGMFIDRREQGKPGDFTNLTDEELNNRLLGELRARGLSERHAKQVIEGRPISFSAAH